MLIPLYAFPSPFIPSLYGFISLLIFPFLLRLCLHFKNILLLPLPPTLPHLSTMTLQFPSVPFRLYSFPISSFQPLYLYDSLYLLTFSYGSFSDFLFSLSYLFTPDHLSLFASPAFASLYLATFSSCILRPFFP